MIELRLTLHGRVQGVLFRRTAQKWATELDLTGLARNEADGTLHIVAQGDRPSLAEFLRRCYHGPQHAAVTHIDVAWAYVRKPQPSFTIT